MNDNGKYTAFEGTLRKMFSNLVSLKKFYLNLSFKAALHRFVQMVIDLQTLSLSKFCFSTIRKKSTFAMTVFVFFGIKRSSIELPVPQNFLFKQSFHEVN